MADKGAVSFQAPGQEPEPTSTQEQGQGSETKQPQYVTVEEARRLADEAAENAFRRAQSLVDRTTNKKGAAQGQEAVQPQGEEPTEEAQPEGENLDDPAVINGRVAGLYQKYGVQIFEGEPEAAKLDYSSGANFLTSLESAIKDKATRLSREVSQPAPQARTPTNAGGTGAVARPDLQAQYSEALSKIPRGSVEQIANLKSEFRKKGLEVW